MSFPDLFDPNAAYYSSGPMCFPGDIPAPSHDSAHFDHSVPTGHSVFDGHACTFGGSLHACNDGILTPLIGGAVTGAAGGAIAGGPAGVPAAALGGAAMGGLKGCVQGVINHNLGCHTTH